MCLCGLHMNDINEEQVITRVSINYKSKLSIFIILLTFLMNFLFNTTIKYINVNLISFIITDRSLNFIVFY